MSKSSNVKHGKIRLDAIASKENAQSSLPRMIHSKGNELLPFRHTAASPPLNSGARPQTMPLPILRKLQESRESRRLRKQAWLGQDLPDAEGVTPFQHAAVAALQGEFAGVSFSSADSNELYLCGALPGADATLFIYKDGAQLQAPTMKFRAERWDYESPSALIEKLVLHGREALRSN